jgi:hypothetical protein
MVKDWYVKHKETGKYHKVKDVHDMGMPAHEGGGNMITLEGLDKPVHASKLEDMRPDLPMQKKEKIEGGLADGKSPSDFDPKQLAEGVKIEMEHTDDKDTAAEIAMDHLAEDPDYYKKLKEVEKYDRVDEEKDGKREFDYGKEELEKRWNRLKKAMLDNKSSIMSLEDQEYSEDQDEDTEGDGGDGEQPGGVLGGEQPEQQGDPDQEPQPQGSEDAAQDQLGEASAEEGGGQGEGAESPSPEELEQMLQDHGFTDGEIAYILHGMVAPQATVDDIKVDSEQAMAEHKLDHQKRMDDVDHQSAQFDQETNSVDREHKQRMLELEYEYAKKMKELELKHKEKEYEMKLSTQKQKAEKAAKATHVRDTKADAAQTSQKEKAGK